jgi:hypothetical protein
VRERLGDICDVSRFSHQIHSRTSYVLLDSPELQ